jgi:DNA-binding transcriptional ArsR family regulator
MKQRKPRRETEAKCADPEKVERVRERVGSPEDAEELGRILRALGDPTRVVIARALAGEELCVSEIVAVVGAPQSTVSHSLQALKLLGLIQSRRVGQARYYRLNAEHIRNLLDEGFRHVSPS